MGLARNHPARKYCPVCRGTGLGKQGALCSACHGEGHVELMLRRCADMRQTALELREQGREMIHLARELRQQAQELRTELLQRDKRCLRQLRLVAIECGSSKRDQGGTFDGRQAYLRHRIRWRNGSSG